MKSTFHNSLVILLRRCYGSVSSPVYTEPEEEQISWTVEELSGNKKADLSADYRITVSNDSDTDFRGVLELRVGMTANRPKFFMPGYLYNRNTADMKWGEAGAEVRPRKEFPRIKLGATERPESEFFMTRADRLAAPVSLIYDDGRVIGISGKPWTFEKDDAQLERCKKELQKFREGLKNGDKVVTSGGIYGTIVEVSQASGYAIIEIDKNVKIRVVLNALNKDFSETQQQ